MGRPRTDIGTYGEIGFTDLPDGRVEARARFRMRNGTMKRIRRRGPSKNAARTALKKAMAELADEVAGKHINGDTRLSRVMDMWLADFAEKVELGKRAPKSLYDYRDIVNNHVRPRMGDLACREAENAGLVDETLKEIRKQAAKNKARAKSGTSAMLRARTVLSGICGYAVRHGAMRINPVKSIEQIDHDQEEIRALEPEERADFLLKLRAFVDAKITGRNRLGVRARAWTDLPDLVEAMLSTGVRIGEVLAVVGDGVDPAERKVIVNHHLIRVEGQGIVRVPKRKGKGAGLEPEVPSWSLPMWRRRKLESGGRALFPAWNGAWEDPSNVTKRIKKACDGIGYGWVSSRMFRHTVGSHLGDSGLTNEQIADHLGNTPDVVEGHYRRKRKTNPKVAAALENLMEGT